MAEYCKECLLQIDKSLREPDVYETDYEDICERCGEYKQIADIK